MARRLILDSGALIAFTHGDTRVRALLRDALSAGVDVVIAPIVVTETVRDPARDSRMNQLIGAAFVPFVGLTLARAAGLLLARVAAAGAADAQVMAEALRRQPSTVVTSDPEDMRVLAGASAGRGVRIVAI